jgi:hypothetical protein
MILKLRDTHRSDESDRFTAAGNKAEDQMSFYLKRAFEWEPNVYVFNDLRLTDGKGDFAQFDHLVLFAKGMVIIESKSVTSKVKINKLGEWMRLWDGGWRGFASPIQQAKRQVEFLQNLLTAHKTELRGKILFGTLQVGFKMFPIDVLIAISDSGTIQREGEYPEVVKADQVVDRIRALIKKRNVSFFSWAMKSNDEDKWDSMNDDELKKLTLFMLSRHTPRPTNAVEAVRVVEIAERIETVALVAPTTEMPSAVKTEAPSVTVLAASKCEHCNSSRLQIKYGHNYYFSCLDCAKNTRIDLACPTCKAAARIRKERLKFFKECVCGFAGVFFVNPA